MSDVVEKLLTEISKQSNCLTIKDTPSNAVVTLKQRHVLQVINEIKKLRELITVSNLDKLLDEVQQIHQQHTEIEKLHKLLEECLPHFERGQPILWKRIREVLGKL